MLTWFFGQLFGEFKFHEIIKTEQKPFLLNLFVDNKIMMFIHKRERERE